MKIRMLAVVAGGLAIGAHAASAQDPRMNFFVASLGVGNGGDMGGLAGADQRCQSLAYTAGLSDATWHAYLSVTGGGDKPAVNARDRIGEGPFYNFRGLLIAESVAALHSADNPLNNDVALNEKGEKVKWNFTGDTSNRHEILTGSRPDGTAFPADSTDHTCADWTSSGAGSAVYGNADRTGDGDAGASWNSAGATPGCSQQVFRDNEGDGLLYCFGIR